MSLSPSYNALENNMWAWSQFPPGAGTEGGESSAFGSHMDEVMANSRKTTPPINVTGKFQVFLDPICGNFINLFPYQF